MGSRKKESEGIALLSMYNDEDMDDADEDFSKEDEISVATGRDEDSHVKDPLDSSDFDQESRPRFQHVESGSKLNVLGTLTPQHFTSVHSPPLQNDEFRIHNRGQLTIVDYGHDEAAMSPEAEYGEVVSPKQLIFDGEQRTPNGDFQGKTPPGTVMVVKQNVQLTSQFSEVGISSSGTNTMTNAWIESEAVEMEEGDMASVVAIKDVNMLDRFIPSPPKVKCSDELQEKINKFLAYKRFGKSFNAEVRNRKDYRNPDFLVHAVRYQEIDQIGTCFGKDVFDPHGYDKSDYYDEIEADIKREMERKEQEKKRSPKVDFVPGGMHPGNVSSATKINLPVPGVSNGLLPISNAAEATTHARQNKKSKWDKVDVDRRNHMSHSGQDVGTQATLLSAANAGAGYTAFAQQRRREAEEKRLGERKPERKS